MGNWKQALVIGVGLGVGSALGAVIAAYVQRKMMAGAAS